MPTFRSKPSTGLFENVRKAVAASRLEISPEEQRQAAAFNAQQDRNSALAEKARMEVEQARAADAARRDPRLQTQYATHAAGMSEPEGTRLMSHLRGELEQPSVADINDADMVGATAQPFPTAAPVIEPGQRGRFQGALASTLANLLATGDTNAQQLTAAGGNLQGQAIAGDVQDAIGRGDIDIASAMSQGAKPGTAIKLHDTIGNTGATFMPGGGSVNADPEGNPLLAGTIEEMLAKAEQASAAGRSSDAHAGLYGAQATTADTLRPALLASEQAQARQRDAAGAVSRAHAGLYGAQTKSEDALRQPKVDAEMAQAEQRRAAAEKSRADAAAERMGGGKFNKPLTASELGHYLHPGTKERPAPGSTLQDIIDGGFQYSSTAEQNKLSESKGAYATIARLDELVDSIWNKEDKGAGFWWRVTAGSKFNLQRVRQSNPELEYLDAFAKGTIAPLIRAVGEKGNLANEDIERAIKLIPNTGGAASLPDTPEVARGKMKQLREWFDLAVGKTKDLGGGTKNPTRDLKDIVGSGGKAKFLGFE